MILTNKQEEALKLAIKRYRDGEPYTVISGYAGVGKAQPIDTIIPTPKGPKKIGKLKPGDYVFDKEGKPTKVISVHPQGLLDVYTLKLKDGRKTKCGAEHIWTIIDKHNKKRNLTTEQLIKKGLKNSSGFKYAIPNNGPLIYPEQIYKVDPYVIGVFLGDGCCKERQLTLSSETEEIPAIIAELTGSIAHKQKGNYNWTFELPNPIIDNNNPAYTISKIQTKRFFRDFIDDICCDAREKRIPVIYKHGSVEQRLNLLQGLFDTDGSISESEGRFNIRYTSINLNLIKDIQEVLYSLGYSSTIIKDNRANKYSTGVCYNLSINIPNEEKYKLFRLSRKKILAEKARNRHKNKNYSKIAIVDIQKEDFQAEMICIYVDNSEHLYLTNDCIVTHNTTLVNFIISALDLDETQVVYAAYTGKAAQVLRNKGCFNAMTTHKLLYKSIQKSDGSFIHIPYNLLPSVYKIIVIDEISMLPKEMWDLLLSHNIHVIACGDPGQLPPIGEKNGVLEHPHIFLDEVVRQAKDNDIIRLSMDIREGKTIKPQMTKDINIVGYDKLVDGMFTWADQIICGKNNTRHSINDCYRKMKWGDNYRSVPLIGDKIICLKNNWDKITENGEALVNGSIGHLIDMRNTPNKFLGIKSVIKFKTEEDEIFTHLLMDWNLIVFHEPTLNRENFSKFPKILRPEQFDYGYCITAHKSQGSEYPKVLVIEEILKGDEHKRWLYTAVTRAQEKLTLVLQDY